MNRTVMCSLTASLSLALAMSAAAQSAQTNGQAQGQAVAQTETKDARTWADANAQAQAGAEGRLAGRKSLEAIRDKGAKTSAEARAKIDRKLDAAARKADEEVQKQGDAKVATRLAAEFGMTTVQLEAEKDATDASWGQLMIAHSLDANTKTDVTVGQLFQLREEGIGWGQIAAGLGLKMGDVVSAVQTESRVATGLSKPDGKMAVIHGESANAGVNAGMNAGVHSGGAQAAAQTGIGVGLKIKP